MATVQQKATAVLESLSSAQGPGEDQKVSEGSQEWNVQFGEWQKPCSYSALEASFSKSCMPFLLQITCQLEQGFWGSGSWLKLLKALDLYFSWALQLMSTTVQGSQKSMDVEGRDKVCVWGGVAAPLWS